MCEFPGGGNGSGSSSCPHPVPMDEPGESPGMNHHITVNPGVIPELPSHIQNLPPSAALLNVQPPIIPNLQHFTNGAAAVPALPSRIEILQEALQLCTAAPTTRDDKMDLLLSMMTSMFKLMLLDHVGGASGGSSPLSLRVSSFHSTPSSGSGANSPHFGRDETPSAVVAGAHFQSAPGTGSAANANAGLHGQPPAAAAHFFCPACPSSKAPLTEKSFNKHILAWKKKAVSVRKMKPGSCPGIRSLEHPLVAGLQGTVQERVDTVVNHTKSLLTPGASAAHTPAGSGNFQRVEAYFQYLKKLQP